MKNEEGVHDMSWAEWSAVLAWISGIVVAKGGWATFFAVVFPPWAWYLLIQFAFRGFGWL